MLCGFCGADVPTGARFCPSCGHELARRGDERRIVTVLFADIVGFTGLSETLDPEKVKNLVDGCFARLADDITSFGGRVDKVVGDAIVALFGAPVTHEDDAERAVRAALRMQETVKRFDRESSAGIRVRIGVNTGEVLVGGLVAGDDYTAMGDVVNIASRLQTIAEPGTVLVGPDTYADTRDVIRYGPEDQCHLRGRDEPVPNWRAIEPIGRPGARRADTATRLIGRDPEMGLLRRATMAAFRRHRAHLLLVLGETGVGKSRLADELVELVCIENDALVLAGRCQPYGEANVWWPIAETLSALIGDQLDGDESDARSVITTAVAGLLEPGDLDRLEQTVEGILWMLGRPSRLDELDPVRGDEESARAVRALLYRLAAQRPLMIWLADLHLADDLVLRFVDDTLNHLGRQSFVVIATGRGELVDRWTYRAGRYNALSVTLEPLDIESAELLLDELLDPDVDADLRGEVLEHAGGNPLFLHEIAKMVGDGAERVEVPGNIRSVIGARLDALDDESRLVLEDAASIGLRGSVGSLEQMALDVRGGADVQRALIRLGGDGLLELDDGSWAFRSSLIRDVAYLRLTKTERAWRHAGIAAAIETGAGKHPDTIAYHYRAAAALDRELGGLKGLPEDLADRAVDWTLKAAGALSGPRAGGRVGQLYAEALELLDEDDVRRAPLLLERARWELTGLRVRRAKRFVSAATPLVEASADKHLDLALALVESEVAQREGDSRRALDRSRHALALLDELDDPLVAGESLRRCGMVHLFLHRESEAETLITAAYDAYRRSDDARGMAWARQNLAWISFMLGRLLEAEERLGEAIHAFDDLGDFAGIAWSRGLLAYVRIYEGRFAEASELAERTLLDAQERGDVWGEAMMTVALGTVALWTGRVDEAIGQGETALALFTDGNDPEGIVQATAVLGRALARSGRVDEGMRLLRDTHAGDRDGLPELLCTAGMAASATVGDVVGGRRFGTGPGPGVIDPTVLGQSDRVVASALLSLQGGDLDGAIESLQRLPGVEDPTGSSWALAVSALTAAAHNTDPGPFISAIVGSTRATYADQVLAHLADACWRAASGDESAARAALSQADLAIPSGGDRIHPFIAASARAECLGALGAADAADAFTLANTLAAELGIDPTGWHTAFATVLVGAGSSRGDQHGRGQGN